MKTILTITILFLSFCSYAQPVKAILMVGKNQAHQPSGLFGNLKEAKTEINNYLKIKKGTYEKWASGLVDSTLDEETIKDLLNGERQVVTAILLKQQVYPLRHYLAKRSFRL